MVDPSPFGREKLPRVLGTASAGTARRCPATADDSRQRTAAAGEPRLETDFFDAGAWRAYQDQWFAATTGGEVLPPVGNPDRAKRWKARRRAHAGRVAAGQTRNKSREMGACGVTGYLRVVCTKLV